MNQFENDPRLKNLMPLKRQIILELANGSHNATMEQMLPQIMQLNRELQKRNLSFSKEESKLIMDINRLPLLNARRSPCSVISCKI